MSVVHDEGNNNVTLMFTLDSKHVYIVNNGNVEKEEIKGPIGHYADSGPNVGYLQPGSNAFALMIRDNTISRIKMTDFSYLRQNGKTAPSNVQGVIQITFPKELLGRIETYSQYKMQDRSGGDFDNATLGQPIKSIDNNVPVSAQELAMRTIGRQITAKEVSTYRDILSLVDNGNGVGFNPAFQDKQDIMRKMADDKMIAYDINRSNSNITFSLIDSAKTSFMRKAIQLCEEAERQYDEEHYGNPEPVKNNIDPHVPDLVQDLAMRAIRRQVTEKEIQTYKEILDAVDNNSGGSLIAKFNDKMDIIDKMIGDMMLMCDHTGSYITFALVDKTKTHFMRRAVELYDGAHIVSGEKAPSPMMVAAAAMNLSQEDRERIGLVNQGTVAYQSNNQSVGQRRFGSASTGSGTITTGSIHRPRSLGSTAVFPFDAPCVVKKTAPYYTMMSLKKPFVEFAKPIESFLTARITIDKRIPMRVVPMVTNDRHGYAFPKRMVNDEKVVSTKCTPVATRVPGVYWIFYELMRYEPIDRTEFQTISRALIDYISSKSTQFDLSASSAVAGVASNLKTKLDDVYEDTGDKQRALGVYKKFFEETGKGLFRPMKISYSSGFVIAITRSATQVLLMSVVINSTIDYSLYPEHITVIPIEGEYGLLVVGAEPTDIAEIERVMSGTEQIADDDDYDQPDD